MPKYSHNLCKKIKANAKSTCMFSFKRQHYFLHGNDLSIDSLTGKNIIQKNIALVQIANNSMYLTNIYGQKYKLLSNNVLAMQLTFDDLPNEIIDIIYNYLDLASQVNFRLVSTRFTTFHLTNFWNFDSSIVVTDEVIANNPFIKYLDLSNNKCVNTVENLVYLTTLKINGSNVTTLSNLPKLKLIMINDNDDIQIPNSDDVTVVKTKPWYSDVVPYAVGCDVDNYFINDDYINASAFRHNLIVTRPNSGLAGTGSHAIIAVPECKGLMSLLKIKYCQKGETDYIKTSVKPIEFHTYFNKYRNFVTKSVYDGTRIHIKSSDEHHKDILLYHNETLFGTVAHTGRELRFVATGSLVESDHITKINGIPIKKICAIGGQYKVVLLTTCGKLFALEEFDSDKQYDLATCRIVMPNNVSVTDIDCTYDCIVALSETVVYKITQNEQGFPLFAPVKSNSLITAIKCQQYRTIYQTIDGLYADGISGRDNDLVHIDALNNMTIEKFECTNYHILALDSNGDLYSVAIDEYGFEIDETPTKLDLEVADLF